MNVSTAMLLPPVGFTARHDGPRGEPASPLGVIRRPPARATLAPADPAGDGVTDGTAPAARRRPVRLDGPPSLARAGAALGRRGLRALPHGRRGRELAGLPGPDPVPAELFGICAVGTSGSVYAAGDAGHGFAIMSV